MNEQLRDKARALGLDRLTEEHLTQFERATTGMERHVQSLPCGMPVTWKSSPGSRTALSQSHMPGK